ncbi:hypothetical protein SGUI_1715 [Serinicoccus hydrothermalis]|uniref:Uncharacterized protein n=1 Tax=Serinicoccus hydrothermalis TaxID=1758689 RepID=A0A1B1NCJ4_9MICO|nr:hypothetical protein [Serinicoccus hydrothermalis]ANS79111.1 hypothetical protein SGUI_1715 [Serinicoccus hydrothermalis]
MGTTLGGAATGAALGVLAGLVSPIPAPVRMVLLVLAVVALTLLDLLTPALPLPQRSALIPQEVFARGIARGGFRFGLEYGCGWRTLVPSAASWLAAVFVLLVVPPWWAAVVLGAAFGFSRSWAVLVWIGLGAPGWQDFLARHSRVLERAGSVLAAVLLLGAAWARLAG